MRQTTYLIAVGIFDEVAMQQLNHQFLGKSYPTNVLAFPSGECLDDAQRTDDFPAPIPFGDIALCPAVIRREAQEQQKTVRAHWAHLFVHGLLHLYGFEHETDQQTRIMQRQETAILNTLGFVDPYADMHIDDPADYTVDRQIR